MQPRNVLYDGILVKIHKFGYLADEHWNLFGDFKLQDLTKTADHGYIIEKSSQREVACVIVRCICIVLAYDRREENDKKRTGK